MKIKLLYLLVMLCCVSLIASSKEKNNRCNALCDAKPIQEKAQATSAQASDADDETAKDVLPIARILAWEI